MLSVFSAYKFNLQALNTYMKPFSIIKEHEASHGKGVLNNTFTRFIGPADSIFNMLVRSIGQRKENRDDEPLHFIIYDKNPTHIEMFKYLLAWDGNVETNQEYDYSGLLNYIEQGAKQFELEIAPFVLRYKKNSPLDKTIRYDYDNFTESWNSFKNCHFTYLNIDIIENNTRFITFLDNLPHLRKKLSQFVKIDINPTDYDSAKYQDAIDNILHNLWLKNIKLYPSVTQIATADNLSEEDFSGKLYTKRNPSSCILPWMHIQYKPTGQSKLCCRYDIGDEAHRASKEPDSTDMLLKLSPSREKSTIQTSTMEESFFGDYWSAARDYTVDKTPLVGCYKCYKEEQGTKGEVQQSMRLGSAILYNEGFLHKRPKYAEPKLEFLEVGFGNYCNLACLTCNSSLSTTWHNDELELNQIVNKNIKRQVFQKLDNLKFVPNEETLKTLRVIKFTGGEPMINPEFIKFVDLICKKGKPDQISLEIYTNCSYIPGPKLLENLAKFEAVQLNLSIDAFGQTNDYIRYGSIWEGSAKQTVSNAIDHWLAFGKQHENISIIMSTTLSVLSILEIPKLMTWWTDKYKNSGNKITVFRSSLLATEYDGFFKLQPAHDPSYINLNILPKEYYADVLTWVNAYREEFVVKYADLGGIPECIGASLLKLEQLISKAEGSKDSARDFINYIDSMDKVRKNSGEKIIPEILNRVREYLLTPDTQ